MEIELVLSDLFGCCRHTFIFRNIVGPLLVLHIFKSTKSVHILRITDT